MATPRTLEHDIARAFRRACREREWEVAEFLLQALEAIAAREGDDTVLDAALLDSLQVALEPREELLRAPDRERAGRHRVGAVPP